MPIICLPLLSSLEGADERQNYGDQDDHEQPVVDRDASDDREQDQEQDEHPKQRHCSSPPVVSPQADRPARTGTSPPSGGRLSFPRSHWSNVPMPNFVS